MGEENGFLSGNGDHASSTCGREERTVLSGLMCHTLRRKVIWVMANSYNRFPTEGEKP